MSALRFLRKATLRHPSSLAIIALPDEATAFHTYRLLQHHGISPEHLAIVGQGYSSPDRVGLLEPIQIARRRASSISAIAGCLGAAIGLVLFIVGYLELVALVPVHWMLIPIAAIAGCFCGGLFGGLFGFLCEGSTAGIYRHHLRKGHYLLMVEGSPALVGNAQEILSLYCHLH